ncbi:LysR family transcriptional regulator [Variovorax sp. PBL-E5]|uniref:LysR family transcriptional regulator n=1 Tax=Variovorax sp. PBL-E5 TaxID=434014 RepID=UPI001316C7EF|nr:LysR family transcriptional regulator [Variovorax sp. PBL-E5]VTU23974.1 Morphology and auto-aggregation control protein [Variovorax sp. PBL-E5]
MNLRTLKYFVAIVDAGSLTAAAEAIAIAQPALSRQMHDLERDLGAQLLLRTPRGVRMTKAGAALYESAQRMLAEAQKVRKHLEGPQPAVESSVVLGASPTLSRVLVPGVFERCQRSLAGVKLTVREAFTPMLLEWLEKGLIDMAIITSSGIGSGRGIATQPLLGEPFVLVTQKSRQMSAIVPVTRLPRIPLLMTTLHRSIIEHDLMPLGIHLNVHSEIDSVDTIRELVMQGHWSTLMPVSVFKPADPQGRIVLSEVSGVQLNRQLMMATRIERNETAAISVLKDLVQAELVRLTRRGMFSLGNFAGAEPAPSR